MHIERQNPKKPRPTPRKTRDLLLRLWPEEYEEVAREAELHGMTLTAYIRQIIREAHHLNPSRYRFDGQGSGNLTHR